MKLQKRVKSIAFHKETKNSEVYQEMMNALIVYLTDHADPKTSLDIQVCMYLV